MPKTLLSDGASKEDIAMSIFKSVVVQTISGLACGKSIRGRIALLGGPLHFLPCLKQCFVETLQIKDPDVVSPTFAHAMVCRGAALHGSSKVHPMPFEFLIKRVMHALTTPNSALTAVSRLAPLFSSQEELRDFRTRHSEARVKRADISQASGPVFVGIDSGSTTLKLALLNAEGQLLYNFYKPHQGENLRTAVDALLELEAALSTTKAFIAGCAVTGYGEYLLKAAVRADCGVVETIAHLRAAKFFQPDVDFLLVWHL